MNITIDEPTFVPSKFCPPDDCTSVVVLCVRLDAPHSSTERNWELDVLPALTSRVA
jgi:hypothetical protein